MAGGDKFNMKNKKSILKRFKITRNKKFVHRHPHQNHFNAKQSGDEKRRKRRLSLAPKTEIKNLQKFVNI